MPARSTFAGKRLLTVPDPQAHASGMSHIPEDRHKHGLVLDLYAWSENMVLQRY